MNNPDIQAELLARLQDRLGTEWRAIGNAWDMPELDNLHDDVPAVFVYLHADGADGKADPQTTCPRQRISMVYGVFAVVPGPQFVERMHDIRKALFGWVPSEHHEPMALRSGERVNNGTGEITGPFVAYRQLWSVDTWLMSRNT